MICLETAKDRTKLNRCTHFFCYECIQKWVEVTNCCPLCKVPSLALHTYNVVTSLDTGDEKLVIVRKMRIKAKE